MAIVVHKYGGSSVADTKRIRSVAERVAGVRAQGDSVLVVVSAMGGTTDDLLGLAHQVSPNPDRRELDMLLSVGERISMTLLAMAIKDLGHDAVSFTGSQSGIITNDSHAHARIIEVRPFRIQDELARGKVVIVAGYQGVSYRKEVTTLGRGGSDTTAVALAAALGAERCEIYSDVDGVYSADPAVVPEAKHLESIGYDDMQELASCGARVLNAQAVDFARRAGIAIYCRSSFGAEGRQTIIRRDGPEPRAQVVGVTGNARLALVESECLGDPPFEHARIFASLPLQRGKQLVLVSADSVPDGQGTAIAMLSVVGERAGSEPEIQAAAHSALADAGVEVRGCVAGGRSVGLLVAPEQLDHAVRVCHAALLGEGS